MGFLVLIALGIVAGFVLFRPNTINASGEPCREPRKLSVIIPARNEETNLPHLLGSLQAQTLVPHETIVVDDFSEDRTKEIAERYGAKVVSNPPLPPGWTGKNWALWNGYKHATGDLFAFLDADVRLAPHALESLVKAREEAGGVISVVPFHDTEKWHEKLALILNLLGMFAFMSPFEKNNPRKGLYGSCILTTREDYEKINGHESVKSELVDDLSLGARYTAAGIKVTNFIGRGSVSFRMYPQGIKSEIEGFAKSAVPGTSTLRLATVLAIALWLLGLIVSESFVLFLGRSWAVPLMIGYALYTLQMLYFIRYVGVFGKTMPLLHPVSSLFFLFVMLYSLYQVAFLRHVAWKGRRVKVGGGRNG